MKLFSKKTTYTNKFGVVLSYKDRKKAISIFTKNPHIFLHFTSVYYPLTVDMIDKYKTLLIGIC